MVSVEGNTPVAVVVVAVVVVVATAEVMAAQLSVHGVRLDAKAVATEPSKKIVLRIENIFVP